MIVVRVKAWQMSSNKSSYLLDNCEIVEKFQLTWSLTELQINDRKSLFPLRSFSSSD